MLYFIMILGIVLLITLLGFFIYLFKKNVGKNGYQKTLFKRIKIPEISVLSTGVVLSILVGIFNISLIYIPIISTFLVAEWIYIIAKIIYAKELSQKDKKDNEEMDEECKNDAKESD